jgi:hypothetical protein
MFEFLRPRQVNGSRRDGNRRGLRPHGEIGLTLERVESRLAMTVGFGDPVAPQALTPPATEPAAVVWAPPVTGGQTSGGVASDPATLEPSVEDLIKEFKANVERWDVPRDPAPGESEITSIQGVSCIGEWPPRVPPTEPTDWSWEGDLYVGVQGELTVISGGSLGVGIVIDLDHPYESGIYISPGMTFGVNCGCSVGAGFTPADVEGPSANADVNIGPFSITGSGMIIEDLRPLLTPPGQPNYVIPVPKMQPGGSIGAGPGFGASVGLGVTYTLSPQSVFGENIYSPEWWLDWFN